MKNIKNRITRIILLACVALLLTVANAPAATLTVTKTADTNDGVCNADCSLREAIDVAVTFDIINFSSLFNSPQTITLALDSLSINEGINIVGTGADLLTIGATLNNVFSTSSGFPYTVYLSGMTITDAGVYGISNSGYLAIDDCVITGNDYGISNFGTLTINNSTISENSGIFGGGIENYNVLIITNSTVSNNTTENFGVSGGSGGIFNSGILTVINSTISGNAKLGGDFNGGGIYDRNTMTITNSTITNNSADGTGSASGVYKQNFSLSTVFRSTIIAANSSTNPDVSGTSSTASGGYNLIGNVGAVTGFNETGDQTGTAAVPLNPLLDLLGDYGGMTETHRLQTTSPAIDKGSSFGSTEDQRGNTRPFDKANIPNAVFGDGSDTGAYELQFTVTVTGIVFKPPGDPLKNARVLLRGANGERRAVKTDRFGVYRFKNVARNRIYQVSVTHRQFEFAPQIIMVREENISDLNFTALP